MLLLLLGFFVLVDNARCVGVREQMLILMLLRLWFFLLVDVASRVGGRGRTIVDVFTAAFVLLLLLVVIVIVIVIAIVIVIDSDFGLSDDGTVAAVLLRRRRGFFHRLFLRYNRTFRLLIRFVMDASSLWESYVFSIHQEEFFLVPMYDRRSGLCSFPKGCVWTFYGTRTTAAAIATTTALTATPTATMLPTTAVVGSSGGDGGSVPTVPTFMAF